MGGGPCASENVGTIMGLELGAVGGSDGYGSGDWGQGCS